MEGKPFLGKKPVYCADTLRDKKFSQNPSISHRFQKKCILGFCIENQDGHQKWHKKYFFLEILPDDSADNPRSKFLLKSLYHPPFPRKLGLFEIPCRNSRWPPKMAGKLASGKSRQRNCYCTYTLRVKNCTDLAVYRTVSEINAFLNFTQKFKMANKNGGKRFLGKIASSL